MNDLKVNSGNTKSKEPVRVSGSLPALVQLLRPRQWVKNGFVFAPVVFAGLFLDPSAMQQGLVAAVLFSVASSATYIVNDLHDVERDRKHPKKSKTRPIAAGKITPSMALGLLFGLYAILFACWFFVPRVLLVIGAYLILNLAYTFVLKHQPVIDIFTIAIGFVLRIYAGAEAIAVPVSSWMFITTLCLALYLASVKRRQELSRSGSDGRELLKKYSVSLVDRYAEMSATGALLFYSLYVMEAHSELTITVPLVLFGLFRYWYVVEALDEGESPTDALLNDWPLLLTVLAWTGACVWVLWPQG